MKNTLSAAACLFSAMLFMVSCAKEPAYTPTSNTNADYYPESLATESWRIYMYRDSSMQNALPLTDTLVFLSDSTYSYNGFTRAYRLYKREGGSAMHYEFELTGTPFGDLRAWPPLGFRDFGEIISEPFYEYNSPQVFYLWMERI